ncbi:amino acid ABC transporter ATP-binding protein [Roseovarius spongiae]|uniref:Amino acid ABC transporter ATP-binding protein n=1 Tax=Roseovarius spongiae TaxID=2320272 RepID=A0A3A8AU12_9RHOB|nr:amino acid ABC transporter ATP-binding protein [Roseovarius spongiae]RKF14181.1 amino acid ABC transporter ATP-binding protein [Roseovarius spongiae]
MNREASNGQLLGISGLRKNYGSITVLHDIAFEQASGESVVIVGSSGSGKSTLLRCIAGLEDIDDGTILFDGKKVTAGKDSRAALRGEIGMVFQSFNLFAHLTVIENITLAPRLVRDTPRGQADERARDLLEQVGLSDKVHSYPGELSGGQAQRVAIARALAMDPKLILFDEATSALDPELTKEVLDVMQGVIQGGMTVTIVTHEMNFARKAADRMVFMEHGRIVEQGATEDLFTNPRQERTARFLSQIMA